MSLISNGYEMRRRSLSASSSNASTNNLNEKSCLVSEGKKTLYKYTSMDFIESCIVNGVYASKIDAVNDPFESEGVKYPQLYRICCMTNSPKKMLLWAYYTNHRECCIEFDVSQVDPSILRPVNYIDTFSPHTNMSIDEIYDSLYCKGKEWKHENEFRAVYYEKSLDKSLWNALDGNIFLKAPVKSVTFGLFADRDFLRYKKSLETLIHYNIEGKKTRLKNNKYALEDERQFDLEMELNSTIEKLNSIDDRNSLLDSNEMQLLKHIIELHHGYSDRIPIEEIVSDPISAANVLSLLNKELVTMVIQTNTDGPKIFYKLTDLGKNYL